MAGTGPSQPFPACEYSQLGPSHLPCLASMFHHRLQTQREMWPSERLRLPRDQKQDRAALDDAPKKRGRLAQQEAVDPVPVPTNLPFKKSTIKVALFPLSATRSFHAAFSSSRASSPLLLTCPAARSPGHLEEAAVEGAQESFGGGGSRPSSAFPIPLRLGLTCATRWLTSCRWMCQPTLVPDSAISLRARFKHYGMSGTNAAPVGRHRGPTFAASSEKVRYHTVGVVVWAPSVLTKSTGARETGTATSQGYQPSTPTRRPDCVTFPPRSMSR